MTATKRYRIRKPAGQGTTHKIRERLNFIDEKKWKHFSSRRLELIDKFGLSQRKASEQDDNIKQIATLLRDEFGYSNSYTNEFEKLVTAAVQSVRRNRKRSKKKFSSVMSNDSSPTSSPSSSSCLTAVNSGSNVSSSEEEISSNVILPSPPSIRSVDENVAYTTITLVSNKSMNKTVTSPLPLKEQPIPPLVNNNNTGSNNVILPPVNVALANVLPTPPPSKPIIQTNEDIIRSILTSLLNPTSLIQGNETAATTSDLPVFLIEKILTQIQQSRTCLSILKSQEPHSANLENLGEMSIKASISFVIERYFTNLETASLNQLTTTSSSPEFLAILSSTLFNKASRTNLEGLPMNEVQIKLLFMVIGSIVRDFGFDSILYPLNEVVHHVLSKINTSSPVRNTANHTAAHGLSILSAVSMKAVKEENNDSNAIKQNSTLDDIMNRISKRSSISGVIGNGNENVKSPYMTVKMAIEKGTLPKPIIGGSN